MWESLDAIQHCFGNIGRSIFLLEEKSCPGTMPFWICCYEDRIRQTISTVPLAAQKFITIGSYWSKNKIIITFLAHNESEHLWGICYFHCMHCILLLGTNWRIHVLSTMTICFRNTSPSLLQHYINSWQMCKCCSLW